MFYFNYCGVAESLHYAAIFRWSVGLTSSHSRVVRFEISAKFVQYYFRDDGTLAKMRTTFAGFMVFSEHGGGRIVQERIYGSQGKLLQKRLHCFELEKKHRRIKCSGDYSNYDGTYYRRAQNLAFYGQLKSGPSRK